jgi:hypothetical protein
MSRNVQFSYAIARTALMFGYATWTLRNKNVKRLETQQINFLRPPMGASRRDHLRNAVIWQQLREIHLTNEHILAQVDNTIFRSKNFTQTV